MREGKVMQSVVIVGGGAIAELSEKVEELDREAGFYHKMLDKRWEQLTEARQERDKLQKEFCELEMKFDCMLDMLDGMFGESVRRAIYRETMNRFAAIQSRSQAKF